MNHKGERTNATPRGGALRSSDEVRESGRSEGGACSEAKFVGPTRNGRSPKDKAKPYCISRQEVLEAYRKVKSNKGAAGVDEQSIEDFERDLKNNLYRVWNRMSSGSYFPPPVRTVKIPKADGGQRPLGIPTVSDRIAQMVVKNRWEPLVDPKFLSDSYGYRRGKSALDAVGRARQMCWAYDWVCDLDIKGFFDNLDHELMMRAVRKHSKDKWVINPKLRGWFNYYGRFNPSALRPIERHVGQSLVRWACRKYKKLRGHRTQAWKWLLRLIERQPTLLALWERQRSEVFTTGAV